MPADAPQHQGLDRDERAVARRNLPKFRIRPPRGEIVDNWADSGRQGERVVPAIVDNSKLPSRTRHDDHMLQRKVASNRLWFTLAEEQGGLICRRQLLELGLTRTQAATNIDNGRWQRIHSGVYAIATGALNPEQQIWAALPYAGRGAAACCATALWLFGVLDEPPNPLHVSIPESRRVEPLPGLRLPRRRALNRPETPVHPVARPPRIRVEESLLDRCAVLSDSDAVGLVLQAIQRRKTTAARVDGALTTRAFQPKRP